MQRKRSKRIAAVAVGACFAVVCLTVRLAVVASGSAVADPLDPDAADARALRRAAIEGLLDWVRGAPGDEEPRLRLTRDGYIRFLGAPLGKGIPIVGASSSNAAEVASKFLSSQGDLLANADADLRFRLLDVRSNAGLSRARFRQEYAGVGVFGATVIIIVDDLGRVRRVAGHVMTDTEALRNGQPSLTPAIDGEEAKEKAVQAVLDLLPRGEEGPELRASTPELLLHAPSVFDQTGACRLVWKTIVNDPDAVSVSERVLLDAHTGEIVSRHSQIYSDREMLNRKIYEGNATILDPPPLMTLKRSEGEDPVTTATINLAYELFGEIYDFYDDEHDHLGYTDSSSSVSSVVVVVPWPELDSAEFRGDLDPVRFRFIGSWLVDDVACHEFTHAVILTSGPLLNAGEEADALHEGLADMWGEWFDQATAFNIYGYDDDDSPGVEWLCAEDAMEGGDRNMKNPPAVLFARYVPPGQYVYYPYPDVYKGQYWTEAHDSATPVTDCHFYACVADKLCYLLTDGDTFHGYSITGLGPSPAADLFYPSVSSVSLLDESSDYADLSDALWAAADDLGYSTAEKRNVAKACQAVGIRSASGDYYREVLSVRNSSAVTVGYFEDSGDLRLKKTLSTGQASIDASNGGFILKDGATVVAYVDTSAGNGGAMKIKGTLTESTTPQTSADNILEVRDGNGSLVAIVDKDGDMTLKGEAWENDYILQ